MFTGFNGDHEEHPDQPTTWSPLPQLPQPGAALTQGHRRLPQQLCPAPAATGAFGFWLPLGIIPTKIMCHESQDLALLLACHDPKEVLSTWEKSEAKAARPAGRQGPRQAFSHAVHPEHQLSGEAVLLSLLLKPGAPTAPGTIAFATPAELCSCKPHRAQGDQHQRGHDRPLGSTSHPHDGNCLLQSTEPAGVL